MTDDANAPTVPDTQAPAHGASGPGTPPKAPDPRYVFKKQLGQGGMVEVWLAHDSTVDRDIAIKVMRGGAKDPDLVARFLREARVQGRLEHPSVVPVHDLGGGIDSAPFFAMKRLTGTTLLDVIVARDHEKWPSRTQLDRFVDICLAVEFAHRAGVVHRDLKPANIMLGDFGEAYILDWGLARLVGDAEGPVIRQSDLPSDSAAGQTAAGAMLGTPGYMAPEQMRGEAIDQRADVYALGCILFEILTGAAANARDRAIETTLSASEHRPARKNPDVSPELDEACALATAQEPSARLESAGALADRVRRFLDGDRDVARRRELAAQHVAKAQAHVAAGDSGRVDAIREAGSALALEVENKDAQQLLARLLLEPPKQMAPAARLAVHDERHQEGLVTLRWAAVAYLFFLLVLPVVIYLGVSAYWPLVLFASQVLVLSGICFLATRKRARIGLGLALTILIGHCLLLSTIAIILGPLLLTPILLFGSATIMFTVATIRLPKTIVVCHLLVIAIPLALELTGLLPRTFELGATGLLLRPWAVQMAPSAFVVTILGCAVLQMVANMLVLDAQRVAQNLAEERNHAQKWQLQQLVPSSGSTS
jgi:serine/threonine-protein kinase